MASPFTDRTCCHGGRNGASYTLCDQALTLSLNGRSRFPRRRGDCQIRVVVATDRGRLRARGADMPHQGLPSSAVVCLQVERAGVEGRR